MVHTIGAVDSRLQPGRLFTELHDVVSSVIFASVFVLVSISRCPLRR